MDTSTRGSSADFRDGGSGGDDGRTGADRDADRDAVEGGKRLDGHCWVKKWADVVVYGMDQGL